MVHINLSSMTVYPGEEKRHNHLLYKTFFVITFNVVVSTVFIYYLTDTLAESFIRWFSMLICAIFIAVFLLVLFLTEDKKISRSVMLITVIIMAFVCSLLSWCGTFTFKKWQKFPMLRPLMADNLAYSSRKYSFDSIPVTKEQEPNYVGNYNRYEIISLLGTPDNDGEHIIVDDELSEYYDVDVIYAYKDYDGKDFWLFIAYPKDLITRFSIQVVPEGYKNYRAEPEE